MQVKAEEALGGSIPVREGHSGGLEGSTRCSRTTCGWFRLGSGMTGSGGAAEQCSHGHVRSAQRCFRRGRAAMARPVSTTRSRVSYLGACPG